MYAPSLLLLAALLAICSVATVDARRPHVYAIWTTFSAGEQRTILVGGEVSTTTGLVNQTATLFEYLGSSETIDGISAYDQKTSNFYLAPGWPMPLIERIRTAPAALLAPIWLEDAAVANLAFDWRQRMLYVSDMVLGSRTEFRLVSYPVDSGGKVTVYNFPANVQPGRGAIDSQQSTFYNYVNGQLTSFSMPGFALVNTWNVTNCGLLVKLFVVNTPPVFTSRLWGVQEVIANGKLSYSLVQVSLSTRSCQTQTIPTYSNGIVTAMSFDEFTGTLFYCDVSNSGMALRQYDIRTAHATYTPLPPTTMPFAELAVRFVD